MFIMSPNIYLTEYMKIVVSVHVVCMFVKSVLHKICKKDKLVKNSEFL